VRVDAEGGDRAVGAAELRHDPGEGADPTYLMEVDERFDRLSLAVVIGERDQIARRGPRLVVAAEPVLEKLDSRIAGVAIPRVAPLSHCLAEILGDDDGAGPATLHLHRRVARALAAGPMLDGEVRRTEQWLQRRRVDDPVT